MHLPAMSKVIPNGFQSRATSRGKAKMINLEMTTAGLQFVRASIK